MVAMDNYYVQSRVVTISTNVQEIVRFFLVLLSYQGKFMIQMSRVMRKQTFCICENKAADQLRGNREADQRLCFRYIESTIPLLSKLEISSI